MVRTFTSAELEVARPGHSTITVTFVHIGLYNTIIQEVAMFEEEEKYNYKINLFFY